MVFFALMAIIISTKNNVESNSLILKNPMFGGYPSRIRQISEYPQKFRIV